MRRSDEFPLPVELNDEPSSGREDGESLPAPVADAAAASADAMARELSDQRDKYLRLAAEYDNYRKRSMRERTEAEGRGQATLIKQLLDPLDDLSRFAHLDPASVDPATIVQGVDMVDRKLRKVLAAAGVEVIDPVDAPFDPSVHEAVSTEPATSEDQDHMVSRVFQVGYRNGGQLIRPARVVVRQWNG